MLAFVPYRLSMTSMLRPTLISLALASAAPWAFAAGDALAGRTLFNNSQPTCVSCHGSVEARRSVISVNTGGAADPYADISFDTAMTRFTNALLNQPGMQQFGFSLQQVEHIAAYLADTPKTTPVSETQLSFTAAVGGNSAAQTVTLRHATATSENLQVVSVAAIGTGATNFVLQKAGCEGVTLTPAGTCSITVTYAPANTTLSTPDLVFTLKQGPSTNPSFERVLFLSGSTGAAPPPPTPTPPADDSGGGALGLGWLAALGLAVAALARRRA